METISVNGKHLDAYKATQSLRIKNSHQKKTMVGNILHISKVKANLKFPE
jgi:hypothetical protein